MILVTGATGTIGRLLVQQLLAAQAEFAALSRDEARGRTLNCPVRVGDFDDPESLIRAMEGVTHLFLNSAAGERLAVQQIAALRAASRQGVSCIVKISGWGAATASDRPLNGWHAQVEAEMQMLGFRWASLRPNYFMQNLLWSAGRVRGERRIVSAFGGARLGLIDCEDIAACAASLLVADRPPLGPFALTGPESLSFDEIAARFSRVLGFRVALIAQPIEVLVDAMRRRGVSEFLSTSFAQMMRAFAAGEADQVSPDAEKILGRPPRTLDQFLHTHRAEFSTPELTS